MSKILEIPVDMLLPPEIPARRESTQEKFEELCQSIARRGLMQPIGVTDLTNGYYQLRWGMRRSLAHRELGIKTILAVVHAIDEGDAEDDMLSENFQRTEMTEPEEMRAFSAWMKKHNGSIHGCATALNVSDYRVRNAMIIAEGPEIIREAFENGEIKAPVAVELTQVPTLLHTQNLLFHAKRSQCSAKFIRIWREQIERDGLDIGIKQVEEVIATQSQVNFSNVLKCQCCEQMKEYAQAAVMGVCHTCWAALMQLKDKAVLEAAMENEGGNNGTDAGQQENTERV